MCDLLTDFPDTLTSSTTLLLTSTVHISRPAQVESFWLPTGRNAGRVVLKIQGVDSITEAELLRDFTVQMPSAQRVALDEGTYYVSDLLGCEIRSSGTLIGTVADVQFPVSSSGKRLDDSPALFVVTRPDEAGELLIPFAKAFTQEIDVERRRITMALPDGLTGLNA